VRHLVNAPLAGGVALGACANILLAPFDALAIGVVSGAVAVFGYIFISVKLIFLNIHFWILILANSRKEMRI